jgi:small subunit ribosomal protein S4
MVMGISKSSKRFTTNTGRGGRKKVTEYARQLKEKQKLKFIYGVLEKQFYHYFELAEKMEGKAGDNLITILESRLDNLVYRAGYALTRREARELVTHGHFMVGGKRVDIPSQRVKSGDKIELISASKTKSKFKETVETTKDRTAPSWLELDRDNFVATVTKLPSVEDIDYEVEAHLIVELYSK